MGGAERFQNRRTQFECEIYLATTFGVQDAVVIMGCSSAAKEWKLMHGSLFYLVIVLSFSPAICYNTSIFFINPKQHFPIKITATNNSEGTFLTNFKCKLK